MIKSQHQKVRKDRSIYYHAKRKLHIMILLFSSGFLPPLDDDVFG